MSIERLAASNTPGKREYHCLSLYHSAWGTTVRRVIRYDDLQVTLETGAVVTYSASGIFRTTRLADDAFGRGTRTIEVDDADGSIRDLFSLSRGSTEQVQCALRLYLSSDLSTPVAVERSYVTAISRKAGIMQIETATEDVISRPFPNATFTVSNTPCLRGR